VPFLQRASGRLKPSKETSKRDPLHDYNLETRVRPGASSALVISTGRFEHVYARHVIR
jgi:hypothetical protein